MLVCREDSKDLEGRREMCKVAFSVFVAVGLLSAVCIQSIESQYKWHEDAEDQWSLLLREGGTLYVTSEPGQYPLYQIEIVCPNNMSGYTVELKQWRAGDRTIEHVQCSGEVSVTNAPPILEEFDPLPAWALKRFKKNWEQPPGSSDGEKLYAGRTLLHR